MAGTLLGAGAANAAPDLPVQMQTATYNSFVHWFQVYQFGTALEVILIAFLFFTFKPYIPFVVSRIWTHLPVVGIMNRVRNIAPFGGFTLRNGMYRREWRNNIMYYVKKYLGSYFFMGVPFDIVHIDRGFVQDPIMNKYVASLISMGYQNIVALDDALTFNNIDPGDENVAEILSNLNFDSFESAHKNLNPSDLVPTSLIYAPRYSNIPLDSLLGFGAEIGPGSIAAQVDDIFEYRKPPIDEPGWMKFLPIVMLFLAIGLGAAMIMSQVH